MRLCRRSRRKRAAPAKPREALDLQNATERTRLRGAPGRMVGLLHGRMPAAEKTAVMALFTARRR